MVIAYGLSDRLVREISLREIGDDWREVADVAPKDDQRRFVPALAARYLLVSERDGVWHSLAVYADDTVVGHVMWAEEDGVAWLGGLLIDRAAQGHGIGGAATETLMRWLSLKGYDTIRLSYQPDNVGAARLYERLGFSLTGAREDDEVVAEHRTGPRAP